MPTLGIRIESGGEGSGASEEEKNHFLPEFFKKRIRS